MAEMGTLARDVMTTAPSCCTATATLDQVAKLMVQNDCGEIPVVDRGERLVGVITDRDIVCRVVADGKNPMAHTAEAVHVATGPLGDRRHADPRHHAH